MRRHSLILLSISLLFACGSVAAAESQQLTPDAASSCPDNATTSTERNELGDIDPASVAPVRHTEKAKAVVAPRSSTRAATPRWHSFLPGMFR